MQKIIAANWKMFKTCPESKSVVSELNALLKDGCERKVIIFPPFTSIKIVADEIGNLSNVSVGGQNFYPVKEGAFTGEISPLMLKDVGAKWVLIGHSERRHILGESDDLVSKKVLFALEQGLNAMLCIGETLEERESNKLKVVLERQLKTALESIPNNYKQQLVNIFAVAYEPVWAIGTGKVAGPTEVVDAHFVIRNILKDILGKEISDNLPILYGGSVKPDNAGTLLELDNVDGLLVGGASLNAQSFVQIINA